MKILKIILIVFGVLVLLAFVVGPMADKKLDTLRNEHTVQQGSYSYSKEKSYTYSNPNISTTATFEGYEKCPTVSGEGMCPKFTTSDGRNSGTVWSDGTIAMKLKNSTTMAQVQALNIEYKAIEKEGGLIAGTYFVKIGPDQNIFDVVNTYMQTGLFEFVEPGWIIQAQNTQ